MNDDERKNCEQERRAVGDKSGQWHDVLQRENATTDDSVVAFSPVTRMDGGLRRKCLLRCLTPADSQLRGPPCARLPYVSRDGVSIAWTVRDNVIDFVAIVLHFHNNAVTRIHQVFLRSRAVRERLDNRANAGLLRIEPAAEILDILACVE